MQRSRIKKCGSKIRQKNLIKKSEKICESKISIKIPVNNVKLKKWDSKKWKSKNVRLKNMTVKNISVQKCQSKICDIKKCERIQI